MAHDDLTDVGGLLVGHYSDHAAATGCTVVLCAEGAVGGVAVTGGAPGTRETDLLRPGMLVTRVHGILLSGGSAFGLDAAAGVMRYLEERGAGFETRAARVPIVPAAILYDLGIGNATVRPGAAEGYQACLAAGRGPVPQGSVGAGTGATVAKALGPAGAVKGGIGSASTRLPDGTVIAALVAVNAAGDVIDPESGRLVAGPRRNGRMVRSLDLQRERLMPDDALAGTSTTIGVVATNAALTKEQANRLAALADGGLVRSLSPAHGQSDGDVLFALATGEYETRASLTLLGAAAAEVVGRSIVRAVVRADGLAGVPAASEVTGG